MKTFFCLKKLQPKGMTRELAFLLLEELRIRHSRVALRGVAQVELPVHVHLLRDTRGNGYVVDVDHSDAFDGLEESEWAEFLERIGVASAEEIPQQLKIESTFRSTELFRLASPESGTVSSVRHVLLESVSGRFQQLLQEVAAHPSVRASVVKLTRQNHGILVAILAEFPEGISAASLPLIFPSAQVIRVSEDGTRSAFSHIGSSCLWMVRHDLLLQSIRLGVPDGEAKAFLTFGSDDGSLVIDICSWRQDEELPVANFVKMVAKASKAPMLTALTGDVSSDLDIVLQRDGQTEHQGSHVYVVNSEHALCRRALALLADAAELGLGGELEFACWRSDSNSALVYAFLSSEVVPDLDHVPGIDVYALLDVPLRSARLAVRSGWRFLPYMPQDDVWLTAVSGALLGEVDPTEGALVLVDPATNGNEVSFGGRLIKGFKAFTSFSAHAAVLGQAVHVQLLEVPPSDGAKLPELQLEAESAWIAAADVERSLIEIRTSQLFEQMRQEAVDREEFMNKLRSDVELLAATADKFRGLPAELDAGIRNFVAALMAPVSKAGMEAKKWEYLLRDLESWRIRIEGHASILDKTADLAMRDESGHLAALQFSLLERKRTLEEDERRMAADHDTALALGKQLDVSFASAQAAALSGQAKLAGVDRQTFELDVLIEQISQTEAARQAHGRAKQNLQQRAAELKMKSEYVSSQSALVLQESLRVADELHKVESQREQATVTQKDLRQQEELVKRRRSELVDARRQVDELGVQLKRAIGTADPRVEHSRLTSEVDAIRTQINDIERSKAAIVQSMQSLESMGSRLEEVSRDFDPVLAKERLKAASATERELLDAISSLERILTVTFLLKEDAIPERTYAALRKMMEKAIASLSDARAIFVANNVTKLRKAARELDDQAKLLQAKADTIESQRS
jgi:hypothetical protein